MTGPRPELSGSRIPAEQREHRWQASLAIVAAMVLYLVLPDTFIGIPRYVVPVLEGLLLIGLLIAAPYRQSEETRIVRWLGIALLAVVNAANAFSLGKLIWLLLHRGAHNGTQLIITAIDIWLTNVIVFGLWYWELDRGGPATRGTPQEDPPDFLFPQMSDPKFAAPGWRPRFVDYLFVAYTNAAAFSPTDTMPLTPTAKGLMLVQSLVSLLTIALVAARAVNILS